MGGNKSGGDKNWQLGERSQGQFCFRCNAWHGVLGLEPTPELHVQHIVEIFREVRRVLRKDGTLWLNYGDSYANDGKWGGSTGGKHVTSLHGQSGIGRQKVTTGLKPKDLVMMPARIALALQADGWWLRSEIVWAKPNPMPESITDRPTSSHEKMFLLARSARYFYDAEAVRENTPGDWRGSEFDTGKTGIHQLGRSQSGASRKSKKPDGWDTGPGAHGTVHRDGREAGGPAEIQCGRNLRNVWHIATHPYPDAHFATFPPALVEPCIKAGTSEEGCCAKCGVPWVRLVERDAQPQAYEDRKYDRSDPKFATKRNMGARYQAQLDANPIRTVGWAPNCACKRVLDGGSPPSCTVLDPFGGSGTVGLVADRLGRDAILIELNPEYADMARNRITDDAPLFAEVGT